MTSLHTTHLALVASVMAAAVLVEWLSGRALRPLAGRMAVLLAVLAAVLGFNAVYKAAVHSLSGKTCARPLSDGARHGRRIRAGLSCRVWTSADEPYALCAVAGRMFKTQDQFLWQTAEAGGVFTAADREMKIALQNEQTAFVIATVLNEPVTQGLASLNNFAQQLTLAGIDEVLEGADELARMPYWSESEILDVTPKSRACADEWAECAPAAWRRGWHEIVLFVNALALPAAGLIILWSVFGARRPPSPESAAALRLCAVIALTVVANAAVCGILSGAHDRYQARIIWVMWLAMIAMAVLMCPKLREQGAAMAAAGA